VAFIFHTLDAQYWTLGLKMLPNLASFLRILAILACLVGRGKFSDASEDYKAPPQNYSSTPLNEPIEKASKANDIEILDTKPIKTTHAEEVFLKHIVQGILSAIKLNESQPEDLLLHLSSNTKRTLKQWMNGNTDYTHVDVVDVLKENFFAFNQPFTSKDNGMGLFSAEYLDNLQGLLVVTILSLSLLYLMTLVRFNLKLMLFRLFVLIFLLSVPWNWFLLYKKAVASKHATMISSVPEDCQQQKITFRKWVSSLFTIQTMNPCQKYHEALLVDPLWEIAPTQAISETLIRLVLQPSERIGLSLSLCLRSLLEHLPPAIWPIAIPMLFLLLLFLLVAAFGYSIKCPCMIGIEPASSTSKTQFLLEQRLELVERQLKILPLGPSAPNSSQNILKEINSTPLPIPEKSENIIPNGIIHSNHAHKMLNGKAGKNLNGKSKSVQSSKNE